MMDDETQQQEEIESPTQVSREGFLDWVEDMQNDIEKMCDFEI